MSALLAVLLFAQTVGGWGFPYGERAYTTSDPVREDRLGLATHSGRFTLEALDPAGCGLTPYQNVVLLPGDDGSLAVAPLLADGSAGWPCQVAVLLLAWQDCRVDEAGECSAPAAP